MVAKHILGLVLTVAFMSSGCKSSEKYKSSPGPDMGEAGAASEETSGSSSTGSGGAAGAPPSCEPSEQRCTDMVPEACSEEGQWQAVRAACAIACFEGTCSECTEDATQCRDGAAERCVDGVWVTDDVCDATCEDGECVEACTEDRLQCSGNSRLQRCVDGEYVDEQQCAFLCEDGECVGECVPDARRCNPDAEQEAQSCNAEGKWGQSVACGSDSFCVDGACKPCEPDSRRCTETGPQLCSADGEWVNQGACSEESPVCLAGECVACEPGSERCSGNSLEQCDELGSAWVTAETCSGETPACLQSIMACGRCVEGDSQCDGDVPQVCNDQGGWDTLTACSGDTPQCVEGTCTECDPALAERSCQNSSTTQTCSDDGSWENPVSCTGDAPLCREDINATCGCEENQRRCQDGSTPERCVGGTWVPQSACSGGTPHCLPETGTCVACEPGDETCTSGVAEECGSSGAWESLNSCAGNQVNCGGCDLGEPCDSDDECSSNACVNASCATCQPGAAECSGNSVSTCASDGQWGAPVACTNQTCTGSGGMGACSGACAPDQQRCNNNVIQSCNGSGAWVDSATDCTATNTTCQGSNGTASCGGSCAPDQQRCNNNQVQACDNGAWSSSGDDCTSLDQTCTVSNGTASCGGSCAPNQQRCNNNRVQNCNASGGWTNAAGNCTTANQTCLENGDQASCGGSCAPNQQRCNNDQVQTCDSSGAWANTTNCANQNQICVEAGGSANCEVEIGTWRVSVSSAGAEANSYSDVGSVSADGSEVLFHSPASNLVQNDTNGQSDRFVRNHPAGTTERLMVTGTSDEPDGGVYGGIMTSNGRFVVFSADATNLIANDTNSARDVFVHDRNTGGTSRASTTNAGGFANGDSTAPTISDDGRFVAFSSDATNLVSNDDNGFSDIFVRDRQAATTIRASVTSAGQQANATSYNPAVAAQAPVVAFESAATNLVSGITNTVYDIFVHDWSSGTTERVSVSSGGAEANNASNFAKISADGTRVVFFSAADNLVSGDTNGIIDIFVRNLSNGTTTRASVADDGSESPNGGQNANISGNGRFVAFNTTSALVPEDTNGFSDIYVRDLQEGTTTLISVANDGSLANEDSSTVALSTDGSWVVFRSDATNLVDSDFNGQRDIFLRRWR